MTNRPSIKGRTRNTMRMEAAKRMRYNAVFLPSSFSPYCSSMVKRVALMGRHAATSSPTANKKGGSIIRQNSPVGISK